MTYVIRRFQSADAPIIAELTLATIHAIGPRAYSPEQVAAWAARHPGPERLLARVAAGAEIWVATEPEGKAIAYCLLETDGHLDMLYCHPEHTRQGLADRLLSAAEEHSKNKHIKRLYTEASELARSVFERAGYTILHRRDFEIEGVAIHNYAMEKNLR